MLETLYLGPVSEPGIIIYDKAAQKGFDYPLTRIELRLKPRRLVAKMENIKNPFNRVAISDVLSANCCLGQLIQAQLLEVAGAKGLKPSLVHFPPCTRSELQQTITSAVPEFWKPQEFWKSWPHVVDAAFAKAFEPPTASKPLFPGLATSGDLVLGNAIHQTAPS